MANATAPGLRVACIVWLDAMLMLDELCAAGITSHNTQQCVSGGNVDPQKMVEAWESVLDTNYESVFRPAVESASSVQRHLLQNIFTQLRQQAYAIQTSNIGSTANIGGEIYARALGADRESTAAYYTRPEVAEYLAVMTLPDDTWLPSDTDSWRVADFACGTGTLLRAAYRRLRQFALARGAKPKDFHRQMMQGGLCGLDISVIASHLTTTGLVGLQPEVSYGDTSIGVMPLGKKRGVKPPLDKDKMATGSLEIAVNSRPVLFTYGVFTATQGETKEGDPAEEVYEMDASDESFDAVMMNPPYTRATGGKPLWEIAGLTKQESTLCGERAKMIVKKSGGNLQAGLGSVFAHISDMKLKPKGRLGLVLPVSLAALGSWTKTREMIAEGYTDITIAYFKAGAKGKKSSMSADTGMGEIVLTARKGQDGRKGIVYACFFEPFVSAAQAAEAARALQQELENYQPGDQGFISVANDHIGEWCWELSPKRVWAGAGCSNLHSLYREADKLLEGEISYSSTTIGFPVSRIGDIFKVGPTHHIIGRIKGTKGDKANVFEFYECKKRATYPDISLWRADKDKQETITIEPTHYGTPLPNKSAEAKTRRGEKTDLFHQRGMGWDSQKILVAKTSEKMMGGRAWAGLRHDDDDVKFAFAVWANSIFGFVTYWMQAGRQQSGRSVTQIQDIEQLVCPDFDKPEIKDRAKRIRRNYPNLLVSTLLKANQANNDQARKEINIAAGMILGMSQNDAKQIAKDLADKWCQEPSVKK